MKTADGTDVGGAVNVTLACALPAVAVPMIGALGTAAGVTAFDAGDAAPVPTLFVAVTVNVYDVPLVRPVTTIGLAPPLAVMPPGLDVTV